MSILCCFRCNISQCDSAASNYLEPWLNFTIPRKGNEYDQCNRYVALVNTTTKSSYSLTETLKRFTPPSSEYCAADNFSFDRKEKCGKDFKFRDAEYTIANEVSMRVFLN